MIRINLIPQTVQWAQARRRHLKRWCVWALISAAVAAVPLVTDGLRRAEAADLRRQHGELEVKLSTLRSDLQSATTQAHQALVQLERAKALRAKRAWSALLALINQQMPEGCWLTSLASDPATPSSARSRLASTRTPTSASASAVTIEAPRRIKVIGYATDAAEPYQFVTQLKNTGAFHHVVLERSQIEPAFDGSYFRFELVCDW